MHVKKLKLFIFFLLGCIFWQPVVYAQCTAPINSFPYREDFETGDGNWVRSSTTHWEWGQVVTKPVITAAGSGTKCWVAGGLSGSTYNSGSSYLQSPCFDISSLSFPQVTFKVFWETERRFDGAGFQYSLDGGANWANLGSVNSNSNCEGANWFNIDPVNFLSAPGWSGNIQSTTGSCLGGSGSSSWLTARHSLSSISGATGVIFRFVFAAGLTCNDFDGFAIDDVTIGETPANGADFSFTCSGNNNVSFSSSVTGCRTGVLWNFGDPASGASNSSTAENPLHAFSSPGEYTVTLTTSFATGAPVVTGKTILVIQAVTSVTNALKCSGDRNAAITVNVNPAGSYQYAWDTNPPQATASISGLGVGVYTVIVTGTNVCSLSIPVTITEPPALTINSAISDARCGNNNGSITTTVTGGTGSYLYRWSNSGTTAAISNIPPGIYSVTVTDANGCTANSGNLEVGNLVNVITVSLGGDKDICPGQSILLSPGNYSAYTWQDNSTAPTFLVNTAGTYTVTVKDNEGCTESASVRVTADCSDIFFPSAFTPNNDGKNDFFGPLGNLSAVNNYSLQVYGRWGQLVFASTDPFLKWDGSYNGKKPETTTYTWFVTYSINNRVPVSQKGSVIIIR